MTRTHTVLVLAAVAWACSRETPTNPSAAAPVSASLVPADEPLGEAIEGELGAARTPSAIVEQLITGGRAGGHADFVAGGIRSKYTFTSVTTVYPAAKGRFELHRWFPDGSMLV